MFTPLALLVNWLFSDLYHCLGWGVLGLVGEGIIVGGVVMSLRVVHAGYGYRYLLRSVAVNDVDPGGRGVGLVDYYQAKGTPCGRWVGAGLSGLGSSRMVCGSEVLGEQMSALLGEGYHPDVDELVMGGKARLGECQLGRAFPVFTGGIEVLEAIAVEERKLRGLVGHRLSEGERNEVAVRVARPFFVREYGDKEVQDRRVLAWINEVKNGVGQAVSGFDLTFSPVKSVSVVWGLADKELAGKIARLHHEAVDEVLGWAEENCVFTRRGVGGIEKIRTRGLIGARFTHFDTRDGDPDLHDHVLVSNKVQGVDGVWRSVDSRSLHRSAQALSARYNLVLQDKLSRVLGFDFTERPRGDGKQSVWEIKGVSDAVIEAFSSRRAQAKPVLKGLVDEWVRKHGVSPSRRRLYQLWQEAILQTRKVKGEAASLDELRENWAALCAGMIGEEDQRMLLQVLDNCGGGVHDAPLFDYGMHADQVIEDAMAQVISRRAVFCRSHVEVAVNQVLRGFRFVSDVERDKVQQQVMDQVMVRKAVVMNPCEGLVLPDALVRHDGRALDFDELQVRYTTREQLGQEYDVVHAMDEYAGLGVGARDVARALKAFAREKGFALNAGQSAMVEQVLMDDARLSVAVGPAGTGKTTSMELVARVWEKKGGKVMGFAPSAAAAKVLEKDMGVGCHTVDWLVFLWQKGVSEGLGSAEILADPRIGLSAGDLLIVDEAGMVSTSKMHTVMEIARAAGAKVLMVGDPAQLDAVDTGGLFKTLTKNEKVVMLDEVMRQVMRNDVGEVVRDEEQAAASMALRRGVVGEDLDDAVGVYAARGWITGGGRKKMLEEIVSGYLSDVRAGKSSLAMAATNEDVRWLNEQIQKARIGDGEVSHEVVIQLADGLVAGVGDEVVARKNDYITQISGVKKRVYNGQKFVVTRVEKGVGMWVRDVVSKEMMWLPVEYAGEKIQVAYASTLHRAQGATVDTAHALITPMVDKNAAYVAITRGKWVNKMYAVTDQVLDMGAEDAHMHMAGDDMAKTPEEIIKNVFLRDLSQVSALDEMDVLEQESNSYRRVRGLYVEGVAQATRVFADYVVDEVLGVEEDEFEGRDAVMNAVIYAANRGLDVRDVVDLVSGVSYGGVKSYGRLVASRVRAWVDDVVDKEEFADKVAAGHAAGVSVIVPPPPSWKGEDQQLRSWLVATREQLHVGEAAFHDMVAASQQKLGDEEVVKNQVLHGVQAAGIDAGGRRFTGVEFVDCDLTGADFTRAVFDNVKFTGCTLTGTQFNSAQLDKVRFVQCFADQADFHDATSSDAQGVMFVVSRLKHASFRGVKFMACVMRECMVQSANFLGAVFKYSTWRHSDMTDTKWDHTPQLGVRPQVSEITGEVGNPLVEVQNQQSSPGLFRQGWGSPSHDVQHEQTPHGHELLGFDFEFS